MALDNGEHNTYIVRSKEIATFPSYIANHIKKHLCQALTFQRGVAGSTYEAEYKENMKEIEVTL